jgi:formylglycine-generating enzyme required for sulfatase activity
MNTSKDLTFKQFDFQTVRTDIWGKIVIRLDYTAYCFEQKLGTAINPLKMIVVPKGSFWMGSADKTSRENPQHLVEIDTFFMSQTPITQEQWRAVANLPQEKIELNPSPSYFTGDNLPVDSINWYQAMEFCARLSRLTQKNYRLPSEAEWEYACRAVNCKKSTLQEWRSTDSSPFCFGKTISTELANYCGYGIKEEGRRKTTPVGNFYPNAFGLYDMHGNVWEWCADPWHDNYDGAPNKGTVWDKRADNNNCYYKIIENLDTLFNDKRLHILRGGSWLFNATNCRSAYRLFNIPDFVSNDNGFRVVMG